VRLRGKKFRRVLNTRINTCILKIHYLQLWKVCCIKNGEKNMEIDKINKLNGAININRDKLKIEKDFKKREILKLKIQIDGLKVKLERIK
jgi:hypothetical protein